MSLPSRNRWKVSGECDMAWEMLLICTVHDKIGVGCVERSFVHEINAHLLIGGQLIDRLRAMSCCVATCWRA